MTLSLEEEVRDAFESIVASYRLEIVSISVHEVLIRGGAYSLYLVLDRDGLSCVYYDSGAAPVKGYNVDLFLIQKRRQKLTFEKQLPAGSSFSEQLRQELSVLARHLTNGGRDILEGSKEWLKEYSWPTVNPPAQVQARI